MHEFGLRPYFTLDKEYELRVHPPPEIQVKAYLVLPLAQAPLRLSSNGVRHSFVVDSVLEGKMLGGLNEDQRQKFRTASAVLRLYAYDAIEDESKFYRALRPCGCSLLSEDEDLWSESEDGRGVETDRAIGEKDLNSQDDADGRDAKQEDNNMGVLSPRASSPSNQTMRKAKLEKAELRPQLMMLGTGDYLAS